jgi:polysaccharide deacetylase family protein (PEP-CTERM system associated)
MALADPAEHAGVASEPAPRRFALSIDVEDYFQVWAFSSVIDRSAWDGFPSRVADATRKALDLFDAHDAKATFFTLGWVAERHPALIREIAARGHEVASHGYDHEKAFEQSPKAFREDAARTKAILENLLGAPVAGYRAPGFSIDARTPFAYATLAELGYRYSSSAHPIAHDHYGDPNGRRTPYRPVGGADFIEAPVATAEIMGRRASCGGGWFRAMPYALSRRLIERAAATLDGGPVIFYFHPWEIDPEQPRIAGAPLKSKLRHYLGLRGMEKKISLLLADFAWSRIDTALGVAP